jgi:hypothetical protein
MRKLAFCLMLAALTFSATTKKSEKAALVHVVMAPSAMQWGDVPPSLPKGGKLAVLEGDPSKKGFFVIRIKGADGYRVAPHWHPTRETLTTISGVFHLGMGDTLDTAKGDAMPAGAFAYMDATMHHYAWMEGETVIQVEGMGPFVINYVDPKDDPSKK